MSKIKICGLSRAEDIDVVNCVMPDYIGFVFARSRRQVSIQKAAELKERLDLCIIAVGVFVDEDVRAVAGAYRKGIVDVVQLHGSENDDYIRKLKDSCGCTVIKAVGIGGAVPGNLPVQADYLLFDTLTQPKKPPTIALNPVQASEVRNPAASPAQEKSNMNPSQSPAFGGVGKAFDWNLLKNYCGQKYFLAGGLHQGNVRDAIELLSPYCVDVSSGVETCGVKDGDKIENFVRTVRKC